MATVALLIVKVAPVPLPPGPLQLYVVPPVAVNDMSVPAQMSVVPLTVGVGGVVLPVTFTASLAVQPFAPVTVTVYVPAVLVVGCATLAALNPAEGDQA